MRPHRRLPLEAESEDSGQVRQTLSRPRQDHSWGEWQSYRRGAGGAVTPVGAWEVAGDSHPS